MTSRGLSIPAIEDLRDRGLAIVDVFLCIGRPFVINPLDTPSPIFDAFLNCVGVATIKALTSLSFGIPNDSDSDPPDEVVEELDVSGLVSEQLSPGTPAINDDLLFIVTRFLFRTQKEVIKGN